MATPIPYTPELRVAYERLAADAAIRPAFRADVASMAKRIVAAWPRYEAVAEDVGAPAHLVALVHAMECGLRFDRHLHNGDPLTSRTVHVPAGRPVDGTPPFTWEESAADALRAHGVDRWTDWSLGGLCYALERYNGFGYRRYHPEVPTPYLWSGTTAYTAGKYTSDGHFDSTAVSKQCGAMALLRGLADAGKPFPESPEGGAS